MIQKFKNINNQRQQRKFLDKEALSIRKKGMDEETMRQVLELAEYLDSIHFWQKYNSLFDETIEAAKAMKNKIEADRKINQLSTNEMATFENTLSILTGYEKDVVVDAFDENKKAIRSILIKGTAYHEKDRFASIQEAKALILETMESKGSLKVQYFNGFRVLKRIKL